MATTPGQQIGRTLLLQISDGATPAVFTSICGITTRDFDMSANSVDTTIPDCINPAGPVVKTAQPGIQNRTFTGNGKFVAGAPAKLLLDHVRAGTVFDAKVIVPGDGTYTGSWFCTNFKFSGATEGTMDFSTTVEAASPPSFVAEV